MTTTRTARFWTWTHRGHLARLALRPGESLTHATGGPTDEGWSSHAQTWRHDGTRIVCDWRDDGCDCDGRLTSGGTVYCVLDRLVTHPAIDFDRDQIIPGVHLPDWQPEGDWRIDHQAEAAGY